MAAVIMITMEAQNAGHAAELGLNEGSLTQGKIRMKVIVLMTDDSQIEVNCDRFDTDMTGRYVLLNKANAGEGTWGKDWIPVAYFESKNVVAVLDSRHVIQQLDQ